MSEGWGPSRVACVRIATEQQWLVCHVDLYSFEFPDLFRAVFALDPIVEVPPSRREQLRFFFLLISLLAGTSRDPGGGERRHRSFLCCGSPCLEEDNACVFSHQLSAFCSKSDPLYEQLFFPAACVSLSYALGLLRVEMVGRPTAVL